MSPVGAIARDVWRSIPEHHPHVALGPFQIMPNHVHGVVTLNNDICENSNFCGRGFGIPQAGSLSSIIGCFKAAVTKSARESGAWTEPPLWQSRFHDHIIRGDADYFWIELYIEANPILWHYSEDNPDCNEIAFDDLARLLGKKLGLDGHGLAMVMGSKMLERIRIKS